jgi:hypothetical protein
MEATGTAGIGELYRGDFSQDNRINTKNEVL